MKSRRILIIDDDDDVREVAALALEMVGEFIVTLAVGGRAGLAAARVTPPDVILLDVMMPELDGPSTFRELQRCEETRAIPVIFLSANVQPAERQKLCVLGAVGFIAKPFDPMSLAYDVSTIAGWY